MSPAFSAAPKRNLAPTTPTPTQNIHIPVRSIPLLMIGTLCAFGGELAEARQFYLRAVEGDSGALKQAVALLATLREERPHDPLVAAYFGSSRLLESDQTLAPWKKGKLAKEGLTHLDAAVHQAPDHAEIRFLRAASTFHLPGWFGRREECEADLRMLVSPGARQSLQPRYAAAALYYRGVLLEKAGDREGARSAWAQAARLSPDTRAGRDAAEKLARH